MGNKSKIEGIKKYTEANRLAWNEVTPIHQKARKINLKKEFARRGFSVLDEYATAKLAEIGLAGKRVAQICCNNGRETLSLINIGAKSAIGFDISDEAIKEARELADIAGLDCEFVRTDVYDIGEEYYSTFDLAFITIGALPWMPDLNRFFEVVAGILKDNGYLVIYEQHPFGYMLAMEGDDDYDPDNPLKIVHSYFREEPWINNTGIDYIGKSKYKAETSYDFTVTLTKIINAVAENGIMIKEFTEYNHDISTDFENLKEESRIPKSYMLIGKKVK